MACYMFLLPLFCLLSNAIGHPTNQSEGRSAQGVGIGTGIGYGGNANVYINLDGQHKVHRDGNNIHITNAGSRCSDASWILDQSTGFCYTIIDQDFTWDEARLACRAKSDFHGEAAELAFVRNQQEQQFITTNLLQTTRSCPDGECSVWIGLRDNGHYTKDIEWSTNYPVTYTNWLPGHPDRHYERCAAQQVRSPHKWFFAFCDEIAFALCVKKGN